MHALPAEARFSMTALLWYIDRIFEAAPSSRVQQAGAKAVDGIAASPGRYTGPVRVVMDESEFDKLHPGDVLVCPITSPVWSVLFPGLGALVTDTGGLLSHPAIIAREYGPYEQRHSGIWFMIAAPYTSQPITPISAQFSVG